MAEARKIKSLKLQLNAVKQSIDAIVDFAEKAAKNHVEVTTRRDNLQKLYSRFISLQDELISLDDDHEEQHFAFRLTVEEAYYKADGILSSARDIEEKKVSLTSKVKLPDIKLPTFNGNSKDWMNFHSIFLSMINDAPQYNGTQKLYYLRTSLSGPALQLIQSIPICEENYNVAWQLLTKHYNDPKKIKQLHVDALFDNAALKKESASDLRSMVENFEANVNALKQLGEPTSQWDTLLIHMLSHQLDATTLRSWKEYAAEKDVETFTDLVAYIYRHVSVLEDLTPTTVVKPTKHRALTTQTINSKGCVFCCQQHPLYMCDEFFKLSLQDKEKFVNEHRLCLNCMRPGHRARECKSSSTCKKCRKRHHTLLCPSLLQVTDSPSLRQHNDTPTTSTMSSIVEPISCASSGQRKTTLLATAAVIIVDDDGKEYIARALLDSGSDTCFITENLAQQLKSRKEKNNLKISGISSTTTTTKYSIRATLRSRIGRYFADLQFYVLPKITENIPSSSIDTSGWNLPSNIFLADPHFDRSDRIDVLIGAEIFFEIMKPPGRIHLGNDRPTLVNSEFGWIFTGPVLVLRILQLEYSRNSPKMKAMIIQMQPKY
ncbi:uncharacterized protein LOC125765617 [Anopheles funestus]|uniref:uncharacterized protein LOC125765617 n=1 Tax=Anopheles funestus TaxID=62324 RepID=UPI0020C6994F|nr:uncharacterized protein LOC125765617 [Anopheles funestus]